VPWQACSDSIKHSARIAKTLYPYIRCLSECVERRDLSHQTKQLHTSCSFPTLLCGSLASISLSIWLLTIMRTISNQVAARGSCKAVSQLCCFHKMRHGAQLCQQQNTAFKQLRAHCTHPWMRRYVFHRGFESDGDICRCVIMHHAHACTQCDTPH